METILETKLHQIGNKAADTAIWIGNEAVSKTANGIGNANCIGNETVSKTANSIGEEAVSLANVTTDQVAVSLESDASAGVGSTRDISNPTAAMTTLTALSQDRTLLATTVLSGLLMAGRYLPLAGQGRCTDAKLLEHHQRHHRYHIDEFDYGDSIGRVFTGRVEPRYAK